VPDRHAIGSLRPADTGPGRFGANHRRTCCEHECPSKCIARQGLVRGASASGDAAGHWVSDQRPTG
jgi:hypothetical protein